MVGFLSIAEIAFDISAKKIKRKKKAKAKMGITYSAGTGTIITSALVTETLGSQSGAASDAVILATAALTPSTHAGYGGQVGTNSFSFGPGDVYTSRLIAVRVGTATEEVKVCIAAVDNGATITLTVSDDWTIPPASADVLHVAYTGDDIETGGAGGGIGYGRKTASWILSKDFTIGNGTDFAFFMLGTSETLEIAVEAMIVENNGLFQAGYLFGGIPINGAYISVEEDATGTLYLTTLSGSLVRLYDTDLKFNLHTCNMDFQTGSDIIINDMKNYSLTYDIQMLAGSWFDIKWTGQGGAVEFLRIAQETTIDTFRLISTAGFHTEDADLSTENLILRDCAFVGNLLNITVNSNKTWDVINPIWTIDTTTQDQISFLTSSGNVVNERYSLDVIIAEADATAIVNSKVLMYEGAKWTTPPTGFVATRVFQLDTLSGSAGEVNDTWIYQDYYDIGGVALDVTAYGWLGFRVDAWLFDPFVASQTNDEKREGTITLVPDTAIVQTTQATALSAGDGIGWNEDANPSELIEWDSGTGTLSVGDTILGLESGAVGVVTQIVSGNSTAGEAHLKWRNNTDYKTFGSEILSNGTPGWRASTIFPRLPINFDIWIDGNGESLQAIYDYLAAETASQSPFEKIEHINNEVNDTFQQFSGFLTYQGYGQSFTVGDVSSILKTSSFYLQKTGIGHSGSIYSSLYAAVANSPISLDNKDTDFQVASQDYEDVCSDGTYVYAACGSDGLRSYSVDALGNLTYIDVDMQGTGNYRACWSDGTFIYVACENSGVRSYSQAAGVLTPVDNNDPGGTYRGVWGDGKFIYATSINGLRSFSVDGSGNLTYEDVGYESGQYEKVWGDGRFIYVSCGTDGVRSYSVDAVGDLTYIDIDKQGTADYENVYADKDFVYIAQGTEGIRTYTVNASGIFSYVDNDIQGTNAYWEIWGDGDFIYCACTLDGVRAYSVDGSGNLTHLGAADDGVGSYQGIIGDGTFIYCTCYGDGLRSYSPWLPLLATSDGIVAGIISGDPGFLEFNFDQTFQLKANTNYYIQVEYAVDDGAANYFSYASDTTAPTHPGTAFSWDLSVPGANTWIAQAWDSSDFIVYINTVGYEIHRWGRDVQGRALQSGPTGFFTDHSFGQGVFLVDYGAGVADYFTDNGDNQWSPPASVTISVTVKDEAGIAINLAQVGVYVGAGTSDRTELMNKDTNASGIATESYTGTVPLDVEVRVRKASSGATKYINYSSLQTISASGLTLSVTMREDPNNNAVT